MAPKLWAMAIPPTSLILGANTHVGAYLARLLQARGQRVVTVVDPLVTTPDALALLGIAADVQAISAVDVASFAPDTTTYVVNTSTTDLLDAALAAGPARIIHIVDHAALHHPDVMRATRRLADLRRDTGLAAATTILGHHDSRLGPTDNLAARITIAAALKAATGWSASTWGRDLVRALCEGAAGRIAS